MRLTALARRRRGRVAALAALGMAVVLVGVLAVLAAAPAAPPAASNAAASSRPPPDPGDQTTSASPSATPPAIRYVSPDRPPMQLARMRLEQLRATAPSDLQAYIAQSDDVIAAVEPGIAYLAILADRALHGEVQILRLLVEAGGGSDAAARGGEPMAQPPSRPEAPAFQRLLETVRRGGQASQQITLSALAAEPAVTSALQRRLEANSMLLFVNLDTAFNLMVDSRNALVLTDESPGASPPPDPSPATATPGPTVQR